ncbi:MAG: hypothetical protein ABEK17_04715 [Candidatus Aenigmatarchaeota archaeon]
MDLRTGMLIGVGIIVLIMSSFLIWKITQTRPAQFTEQSFYRLAKKINQTCEGSVDGEHTSVMVYMPQTFEKKGLVKTLMLKSIPGNAGDPYFQIYYERFPKDGGWLVDMKRMGWMEDLPWTRDFTGFIGTAAFFEFGGEFALPLVWKGLKGSFSKASKLISRSVKSGDDVTEGVLRRVFSKLGGQFSDKTHKLLSNMVVLMDEIVEAISKGARHTNDAFRDVIERMGAKSPDIFWSSSERTINREMIEKLFKRGAKPEEMGSMRRLIYEWVEGKRESYDKLFKVLTGNGLAVRKTETINGVTHRYYVLTSTGKEVMSQAKQLADESGTGAFRYTDLVFETDEGLWRTFRDWETRLMKKLVKSITKRYSSFISRPLKMELGRVMMEMGESQRIRIMKVLDNVDLGGKKIYFRFGKELRERLMGKIDELMSARNMKSTMRKAMNELGDGNIDDLTFADVKGRFLKVLDDKYEEFRMEDVVGPNFWDKLDDFGGQFGDLEGGKPVNKLKTINVEEVMDSFDSKTKNEIVSAIKSGNADRAGDMLVTNFKDNLRYDLMYTRFFDDFSQILSERGSLLAMRKDGLGSLILKMDEMYTGVDSTVIVKASDADAVSNAATVKNSLVRSIKKTDLAGEFADEDVERIAKRYSALQLMTNDVTTGVEGELFEKSGRITNWGKTTSKLKELLKSDEFFPDTWKSEYDEITNMLEDISANGFMTKKMITGKIKDRSLGSGVWRLWLLEIMENNAGEANKFASFANGLSVSLDLRAPAAYGLLRAGSFVEQRIDRSIGSFYNCGEDQLCLQVGRKTYSYKINPNCDVRLDRNVALYPGLTDPRFYLVSPCYAELEIRKGNYKKSYSTDYINWEEGLKMGSKNVEVRKKVKELPVIDDKNVEKGEIGKDSNGDNIWWEETDQGEFVRKVRVNTSGVKLKDGINRGFYETTLIHLKDRKDYVEDIFSGEVKVDIDNGACVETQILNKTGDVIKQYGECSDKDSEEMSVCSGIFNFVIKNKDSDKDIQGLPEVFKVKFYLERLGSDVKSPEILDFTLSRSKDKASSVLIRPKLCKKNKNSKAEIKNNVILHTDYGGGVIESLWSNRKFPNYCYASPNMIGRYMGKESAAFVVSALGAVPGIGQMTAVLGGLALQAGGETFISWPYAYEATSVSTAIERREVDSCPTKLNN